MPRTPRVDLDTEKHRKLCICAVHACTSRREDARVQRAVRDCSLECPAAAPHQAFTRDKPSCGQMAGGWKRGRVGELGRSELTVWRLGQILCRLCTWVVVTHASPSASPVALGNPRETAISIAPVYLVTTVPSYHLRQPMQAHKDLLWRQKVGCTHPIIFPANNDMNETLTPRQVLYRHSQPCYLLG